MNFIVCKMSLHRGKMQILNCNERYAKYLKGGTSTISATCFASRKIRWTELDRGMDRGTDMP
jgi:hypothetical protein